MNKANLIKDITTAWEARIAELKKAVVTSQEMTKDTPGRIESRYDSSREEMGWLTTGLGVALGEMEHAFAMFKAITPVPKSFVALGACFEAIPLYGGKDIRCFVCHGGGGFDCVGDGKPVTLISPDSPLAKAAFGKSTGDLFTVNDRIDYQLTSVA